MFRSGQRAACLFRLSVAFLQNFLCPGGITVPLYDRIGRLWSQQILNHFPDRLFFCPVFRQNP